MVVVRKIGLAQQLIMLSYVTRVISYHIYAQAISIILSSGRTLHLPRLRKRATAVNSGTVPSRAPYLSAGDLTTSSRWNLTRPLRVSKARAGVGSCVPSYCVWWSFRYLELILGHQGLNPSTGKLEIVTTANQDPLLSHVPIIGVDVWEHAFYLQYLNVKVDVSSPDRYHLTC